MHAVTLRHDLYDAMLPVCVKIQLNGSLIGDMAFDHDTFYQRHTR